jgi:cell division initiation protein
VAISPETLRAVEFRSALRGYHPDDVDEFLERMAAGIELLHDRIRETTEQAVRAEQARKATETPPDDDSMRELLASSQQTADAALLEARTAAARLLQTAAGYADALASEVRGTLDRIRADARGQLEADLRRLESSRRRLLAEVTAAERLVLEQGVRPPDRPRWPNCLMTVESRYEVEPGLI